VIEALWPGYADETKALGNLRSALATLQRVLEPDRDASTAPYFLRADNDRLLLDRSITTDVEQFERLAADARDADASGLPARSKELHRRAAALYRGDYLTFLDTGWATLNRVRLQALAVGSMCRVAELSAAQGEPEEALHWAHRALRVDPLAERAIVTLLSSMQATGAVSPARAAARDALDRLSDAGLEPGPGLQRMIDRLR
jgi:two-component SAPR family response regulator